MLIFETAYMSWPRVITICDTIVMQEDKSLCSTNWTNVDKNKTPWPWRTMLPLVSHGGRL